VGAGGSFQRVPRRAVSSVALPLSRRVPTMWGDCRANHLLNDVDVCLLIKTGKCGKGYSGFSRIMVSLVTSPVCLAYERRPTLRIATIMESLLTNGCLSLESQSWALFFCSCFGSA